MEKVLERTPHDVWFNISRFIPRNVLGTLSTVNRSFFNIATHARYEVVTFLKVDKHTKWLCRNLSDPNIGRGDLVRCVNIEPWLVQPRIKSCKQSDNVWKFITGLVDPECTQRKINQQVKKRIQKDIARITDALYGLRNMSEYRLGWNQSQSYHPELYHAFLCPVLTRMKDQLVKLSLDIPPEMLRFLAPVALPRLEHLDVGICTLEIPRKQIDEIIDGFVVFVNNLYASLEFLSISSRVPSQALDFTRFFMILGTFPHLHRFSFSIPFDGTHLSSPCSLIGFLAKHRRTLQYLQLSTSRCSYVDCPSDPNSKYWIPNTLAFIDSSYTQLCEVQLALRPLKADLTPITNFLTHHANELEYLSLTDRALTYVEVQSILDSIGANGGPIRLKRLCLRLKHLSPAFLDLLALRLPHLALLELSFDEVKATANHPTYAGYPAHSKQAELDLFQAEVQENRINYAHWELGTIGISQGRSYEWLQQLSCVFVECIPALQYVVELPPPVLC